MVVTIERLKRDHEIAQLAAKRERTKLESLRSEFNKQCQAVERFESLSATAKRMLVAALLAEAGIPTDD